MGEAVRFLMDRGVVFEIEYRPDGGDIWMVGGKRYKGPGL